MAVEKPVTEKLDKMQIKVADAEQRRTQLEVDLQNIKNKIIDYNKTIKKLEADANATIGAITVLTELIQGATSGNTESDEG
jgi:uncharacterized coiled-coil DUF342 family protein|tara:strand:+ start:294 stop:536 length:243 start_codon:yes stop_codon:yes gene_type:complete